MSTYVNLCQLMSIYVNLCQFMSTYVNVRRLKISFFLSTGKNYVTIIWQDYTAIAVRLETYSSRYFYTCIKVSFLIE